MFHLFARFYFAYVVAKKLVRSAYLVTLLLAALFTANTANAAWQWYALAFWQVGLSYTDGSQMATDECAYLQSSIAGPNDELHSYCRIVSNQCTGFPTGGYQSCLIVFCSGNDNTAPNCNLMPQAMLSQGFTPPLNNSTKDTGCHAQGDQQCGDPIDMAAANKTRSDVDYQAPGSSHLRFERYYNSAVVGSYAYYLARGWMHNYSQTVTSLSSTSALVTRPDGKSHAFNLLGSTWTPDADVTDQLVQLTSGSTVTGWQYTVASDDSLETYDALGNLTAIYSGDGTAVSLTYSTAANAPTFPAGLLTVTDSFGRTLAFTYANGLINTMTDPNWGTYTYVQNTSGQPTLTSVSYPDSTSKNYL